MGIYMGDLILGAILQYTVYASFSGFSQVRGNELTGKLPSLILGS